MRLKSLRGSAPIAVACLVAVAVVVLAVVRLGSHGNHPGAAHAPPSSASSAPTGARASPIPIITAKPAPSLTNQVEAFLSEFYRLSPGETNAGRMQRINALVPAGVLTEKDLLLFGIPPGGSLKPLVERDQMVVQPLLHTPGQFYVTVPVKVTFAGPGGSNPQEVVFATATQWRKGGPGGWTLVQFGAAEQGGASG